MFSHNWWQEGQPLPIIPKHSLLEQVQEEWNALAQVDLGNCHWNTGGGGGGRGLTTATQIFFITLCLHEHDAFKVKTRHTDISSSPVCRPMPLMCSDCQYARRYVVIATKPMYWLQQCTTRGHSYHSPKLHPGPCSSVRRRRGTDTQTDAGTRMTTIHFV